MDNLLVEGALRQLEHLETARRETPLHQKVLACAKCYHLFGSHQDQEGRTIIDREGHPHDHVPQVWSAEQVIIKLKAFINQ